MNKSLNAIVGVCVIVAVFFAQPSTANDNVAMTEAANAPKSAISLNFALFEKLKDMNTDGVLQYLKQHGCKITYSSETFTARVSGGVITVYPPRVSFPRLGVGPVEFTTENTKVRNAWFQSLRKADYSNEYDDGPDIWHKNTMVYGCPTYGVYDLIGVDEEADYAGVCTLYVKEYFKED